MIYPGGRRQQGEARRGESDGGGKKSVGLQMGARARVLRVYVRTAWGMFLLLQKSPRRERERQTETDSG